MLVGFPAGSEASQFRPILLLGQQFFEAEAQPVHASPDGVRRHHYAAFRQLRRQRPDRQIALLSQPFTQPIHRLRPQHEGTMTAHFARLKSLPGTLLLTNPDCRRNRDAELLRHRAGR